MLLSSLSFLFCLFYISDWVPGELTTRKCQCVKTKYLPYRYHPSLLSLTKGWEKGVWQDKSFGKNRPTLAKLNRKCHASSLAPISKKLRGKPRLSLVTGGNEALFPLSSVVVERKQSEGPEILTLPDDNQCFFPISFPQWSGMSVEATKLASISTLFPYWQKI